MTPISSFADLMQRLTTLPTDEIIVLQKLWKKGFHGEVTYRVETACPEPVARQ